MYLKYIYLMLIKLQIHLHMHVLKGIVHFEMNFWYVLAYLKEIKDVGVFVSTVFSILTFFSQTVLVYQSYTGG